MKRLLAIPAADAAAAVQNIVRGYLDLVRRSAEGTVSPEEVKEFTGRQTAARSALAHLEQLAKHVEPANDNDGTEALLAAAREAIACDAEAHDEEES